MNVPQKPLAFIARIFVDGSLNFWTTNIMGRGWEITTTSGKVTSLTKEVVQEGGNGRPQLEAPQCQNGWGLLLEQLWLGGGGGSYFGSMGKFCGLPSSKLCI